MHPTRPGLAAVVAITSIGAAVAAGQSTAPSDQGALLDRLGRCDISTHDPSTIVRCGDEYWFFGTGHGIASYHSRDLKHWQSGPALFKTPPAWTKQINAKFVDYFWAPDVIHIGGRYLLYYSVSSFGSRNSAIGLATAPTLDPADPSYGWTDRGPVMVSGESGDFNAIDASVMLDAGGRLWMALGSFWSGIKVTELDPQTGLRLPSPLTSVAFNPQIEAPAIFQHDGWYYLIVDWGFCCRGVRSTYNMRIGRSRSAAGPFLDRDGVDLAHGGGSLLLGSDGPFIGPGHAGILEYNGQTLISMHFYDATHHGRPTLAIRKLDYTKEGWPVVEGGLND